jgi:hypothetical protein
METRIGRFFPPPFDLAWLIDDRIRGRRRKFGIDPSKERNILLAACKEYQTSIDTWIGGGYHGAFTYFLTQTIREVKGNITYRELIKRTGKKLEEHGFDQLPQLEGQERYFDTPFLSSLE